MYKYGVRLFVLLMILLSLQTYGAIETRSRVSGFGHLDIVRPLHGALSPYAGNWHSIRGPFVIAAEIARRQVARGIDEASPADTLPTDSFHLWVKIHDDRASEGDVPNLEFWYELPRILYLEKGTIPPRLSEECGYRYELAQAPIAKSPTSHEEGLIYILLPSAESR